MRDYYKILIEGASGSGKSYSFRNLDKLTTGFVNVENQPLSFKNEFKNFVTNKSTSNEYLKAIVEFAKDPNIKCIVIDSFSAYMDLVLAECRASYKGLITSGPFKSYLIDWNTLRALYTLLHSNDVSIVKEIKIGQSAAKLPLYKEERSTTILRRSRRNPKR